MRNTCYNYSRYLYIILLMYKISERKHFFTFVKWKFKKHKIITLASFQRSFFSHFLTPLSYIYFPFPLLYFFKGSPVTISIISLPFLTCFFFTFNFYFKYFLPPFWRSPSISATKVELVCKYFWKHFWIYNFFKMLFQN